MARPAHGRPYYMLADLAGKSRPELVGAQPCLLELEHGGMVVGRPVALVDRGRYDVEFDNGAKPICDVMVVSATPIMAVRY
jgi:hypothetical protein